MRSRANPLILKSALLTAYQLTDSFTEVTGMKITIPEDGFFYIYGIVSVYLADTDSTDQFARVKVAVNGKMILKENVQ